MDELPEVLVVVGMFILRLGVPLMIVVAVGYLLRRLDSRWEAEAQAETQLKREMEAAQEIPVERTRSAYPGTSNAPDTSTPISRAG